MNLHEAAAFELSRVFFNLDEFACIHVIEGREISCIVSDQQGAAAARAGADFINVSGLGLLQCDRVVLCQACDLIPQPLPGQKIVMDANEWFVADSGVTETEGLLRLPLNRAY